MGGGAPMTSLRWAETCHTEPGVKSAARPSIMIQTAVVAVSVLIGFAGAASAQDWPTRPITLVVPFAAGGGIDVSARLQAQQIGEILGQTIVVENVGAAAGTIGSQRVAKAVPDGYTFLIGNSGTHAY